MRKYRKLIGLLMALTMFGSLIFVHIPVQAAENSKDTIEDVPEEDETEAVVEEAEEETTEVTEDTIEVETPAEEEPYDAEDPVEEEPKEQIYDEYEYEDAALWYEPSDALGGLTMADAMASMGVEMMDFEAYTKSEIGEFAYNSFIPYSTYGDDITNEENIAYWESIGMKYEYHDEDDPDHKWITMVPLSYYAAEDEGSAVEIEEAVEDEEETAAEETEEIVEEADAEDPEGPAAETTDEAAEESQDEKETSEEVNTEDTDAETEKVEDESVEEKVEKTYPVLFVWHGNDNPIMLAEHYGFAEIAAEKEWIVVCPWAQNDEIYLEEFDRIMDVLREEYPIDENRIYTTGFSKGGRVSQRLAFERPDVITAAVSNGVKAKKAFDQFVEGIDGHTLEEYEYDYAIPIAFYGGEFDHNWPMAHESEEEIEAVNNWLTMHGLEAEQSVNLSHNLRRFSNDPAEKNMGLKFDETSTLHEDGIDIWVGEFKDEDDVTVVRFTEAAGAIHWPFRFMCEHAIEFLEDFEKDPETGLTIYTGEEEEEPFMLDGPGMVMEQEAIPIGSAQKHETAADALDGFLSAMQMFDADAIAAYYKEEDLGEDTSSNIQEMFGAMEESLSGEGVSEETQDAMMSILRNAFDFDYEIGETEEAGSREIVNVTFKTYDFTSVSEDLLANVMARMMTLYFMNPDADETEMISAVIEAINESFEGLEEKTEENTIAVNCYEEDGIWYAENTEGLYEGMMGNFISAFEELEF